MKKLLIALVGATFLTFAPAAAYAECYPIEQAKIAVDKWDKNAQWEYLKSGPKFDAIVKWLTTQNKSLEKIDGLLITYATPPKFSKKVVIFGLSANGQCVEMATVHNMSEAQFDKIVGQEI